METPASLEQHIGVDTGPQPPKLRGIHTHKHKQQCFHGFGRGLVTQRVMKELSMALWHQGRLHPTFSNASTNFLRLQFCSPPTETLHFLIAVCSHVEDTITQNERPAIGAFEYAAKPKNRKTLLPTGKGALQKGTQWLTIERAVGWLTGGSWLVNYPMVNCTNPEHFFPSTSLWIPYPLHANHTLLCIMVYLTPYWCAREVIQLVP